MKRSPMKRTKFKRKSQYEKYLDESQRKKLHRIARKLTIEIVRERDNGICVTCGKPGCEVGHFKHNCLDFDLRNNNLQCKSCNSFKSGNIDQYALYLEDKYGFGILQELQQAKIDEPKKYSIEEYEAIIDNLRYLRGEK